MDRPPLPAAAADDRTRVRVDGVTLQPYQRGPCHLSRAAGSGRRDDDDGASDLDLVALLQPLGGEDAAPVEPRAVSGVEVLDVPETVGGLEEAVLAGRMLIVDDQRALAARGEVLVEDVSLVLGLDDDRRDR